MQVAPQRKARHFKCVVNLPFPFDEYDYTISSPEDVPTGYDALFLAFVPQLAKEDQAVVPAFIETFLLRALGSDGSDCLDTLERIRSDWGTVRNTEYGKSLAHLFGCLRIALEGQLVVRPFISNRTYYGCVLLGGGYTLTVGGRQWTSQPRDLVVNAMREHMPSTAAWSKIRGMLLDDGFEEDDLNAIRSTRDLYDLALKNMSTTAASTRECMLKEGRKLQFSGDQYLAPTVTNILQVIEAFMTEEEGDLPLHPMALTSDLLTRCLSAFGNTAPSFLVPGGKRMELSSSFAVNVKKGGGVTETKSVSKIAAYLVDLPRAVEDWKKMMDDGAILNPFGNAVTRASTTSIVKVYERDAATMILSSLRSFCGVVLEDGGRGKRKAADDNAGPSKRSKMFD